MDSLRKPGLYNSWGWNRLTPCHSVGGGVCGSEAVQILLWVPASGWRRKGIFATIFLPPSLFSLCFFVLLSRTFCALIIRLHCFPLHHATRTKGHNSTVCTHVARRTSHSFRSVPRVALEFCSIARAQMQGQGLLPFLRGGRRDACADVQLRSTIPHLPDQCFPSRLPEGTLKNKNKNGKDTSPPPKGKGWIRYGPVYGGCSLMLSALKLQHFRAGE